MRFGPGIAHYLEELAFYNIIEVEKPKNSEFKKDNKLCKFWLKVEFNELSLELDKLLNPSKYI